MPMHPLARLSRWNLPRPKVGQVIGVLGFPGRPVADTPTVRAEVLFFDDRGYPVRTEPA